MFLLHSPGVLLFSPSVLASALLILMVPPGLATPDPVVAVGDNVRSRAASCGGFEHCMLMGRLRSVDFMLLFDVEIFSSWG